MPSDVTTGADGDERMQRSDVRRRSDLNSKQPMASASSSSARSLFAESRTRLVERVAVNVDACGSVCRQAVRGSRSQELLVGAARSLAAQESAIDRTCGNVQKLRILATHLGYQWESIARSAHHVPSLRDQARSMEP
ncbi:BLOC-1-related complex subunit 7-like [Pollicipes pollicipes]|uniref:BLOC-1-related complex subunit 7-like n=1 Tax=Pollicipes pollicipes TaxID=41117 RepID=UPI001884CC3C|nr:BLOC-1-related complex subunit 7-like [Pollicipes pollicipes]